jgi:hypothetical protein
MPSLSPGRNARFARRLADPRTTAQVARSNPGGTIFLLVGSLFALNALRTGQVVPSFEQGAAWIAAAVALVIVAQVVPDIVTASLLLVLLYVALTNVTLLEDIFSTWTRKLGFAGIGGGAGGVATSDAGPVRLARVR